MIIKATYREIMDSGLWEDFCELSGTDPWCLNEGADENALVVVPSEIIGAFIAKSEGEQDESHGYSTRNNGF